MNVIFMYEFDVLVTMMFSVMLVVLYFGRVNSELFVSAGCNIRKPLSPIFKAALRIFCGC
jgi:hypothetical protein